MYESVATLKSDPTSTFDEYGNETLTYTDTTVFVLPKGVYNSEFYNAAQVGLHPSITFTIANRADYNGEKLIEHEDTLYNIIRADWNADGDSITLVCEERVNNG